jgi:hypothetical protein
LNRFGVLLLFSLLLALTIIGFPLARAQQQSPQGNCTRPDPLLGATARGERLARKNLRMP